jgi:transketolase
VCFFTLIEYLFNTDYKFKRWTMNPFSLSVEELEKARAVRRRIIVLNAESPAGGHTGADLSRLTADCALFRILNCSPR